MSVIPPSEFPFFKLAVFYLHFGYGSVYKKSTVKLIEILRINTEPQRNASEQYNGVVSGVARFSGCRG
jgi:hypothetical protein